MTIDWVQSYTNSYARALLILVVVLNLAFLPASKAYNVKDEKGHEKLSQLTLAWYQHCQVQIEQLPIWPNSENTIRASVEEDTKNMWRRLRNWHFYDPSLAEPEESGIFHRSMRRIYTDISDKLVTETDLNQRAFLTGRILHYLQDSTVPAHVSPVYHGPKLPGYGGEKNGWWFSTIKDQIDEYAIDEPALTTWYQTQSCTFIWQQAQAYRPSNQASLAQQLQDSAEQTREKLLEAACIDDNQQTLPWQAFWLLPGEEAYFGCYNTESDFEKGVLFAADGLACGEDTDTMSCMIDQKEIQAFVLERHQQAMKVGVIALLSLSVTEPE